ncbi:hypothetical protein [Arenibacter latericius]|uniref:hypothetical protein n=1 Tax=Arenibacter latericius TaxID=86104 RepID=UPI00042354DD|nr:hypothetical protein [Arenibacter latericius]
MNTNQTFNIEFLGIGIMLFILVIIPFYFMAKHQSYKLLKKASFIVFVILALLTVGIFIIGVVFNSFIAILGAPTLIFFVYYLILYFIAKYQDTKKIKSSVLFYLILSLFFIPVLFSIIDLEVFSEFFIDLLVEPIDMK